MKEEIEKLISELIQAKISLREAGANYPTAYYKEVWLWKAETFDHIIERLQEILAKN